MITFFLDIFNSELIQNSKNETFKFFSFFVHIMKHNEEIIRAHFNHDRPIETCTSICITEVSVKMLKNCSKVHFTDRIGIIS